MADPQSPGRGVSAHRLSTARLYAFVLIFLVAAGYAIWKSDRFQNLFQGISQARLSQALGVPVSFETVDVRFFPPSVLLANVRIGNDPKRNLPADTPLLEVEEISIGGGVSLVSSTLRLGRIRALRPHVRLIQSPDGTFNFPPGLAAPARGGGLKIDIGSILVQQGVLEFEGRKAAIEGRLDDFMAELSKASWDRYRATLVARRATLQLPSAEPLAMSLSARLLLDPRTGVRFEELHLAGAFGEILATGSIETARGANALFSGSGRLSIDEVERVFHSALGFSGSAAANVTVEIPPSGGFRIGGTLKSARIQRDEFVFEDVRASVAARPDALVAQIEQIGYAGGRATAVYRIANLTGKAEPMTLAVEARGLSVERFFNDIKLNGTGLSGAATLSMSLHWGEGGLDRADGGGRLEITPGPAVSLVRGRFGVPTGGGGPFAVVNGQIRLAGANFRFPESTLTMDGGFRIGDWQPDFDLMIQSRDASEIDRLFQNFMAATGGKPEPLGLGGAGEIQGHLSGTWANPDATVQISLDGTRYANVAFGSARGTVDMRDGAFYFRPLRVYDGDASLSLEGMARYRVEPGKPRFDLSLAARHYPLSRLLEYLDLKFPVDGQITGAFPISGTPEEVTGGGPVELAEGVVWGQKVSVARANVRMTPGRFTLEDVSADVGGGFVRGSGAISIKERTFEARAAGDKVPIQTIEAAKSISSDVEGNLSFQFSGSGSLDHPSMNISATLSQARFFGHPVPEALEPHAEVVMKEGVLDGSVEVPRHWSLRARGDVFGSPAKVDVSLDAPDLASLLKLTPVELPAADGGSVAIEGSIVLPSAEGEWPSGKFTVTRARVDLGDRQGILAASGPVHASLAGGKLTVEEFSAVGEGTSIKLGGQVDLRDKDRGVNFAATGTVDASALSLVAPDVELQGRLTIDARASGSLDKPALSGSVRMEKGKYRLTGLGIILDEVDLTVTLRESRGDLEGRAKFGGGELVAGGSFNVAGLSVKDFRVSVQGRRVRLPTFQDFRVIANADLVVTAAPSGNAIRGEVVLLNATYFKDFDITLSDLLARSRPSGSALVEEWREKTALEIHIVSSESMELRNKAARLTGTVDLVARGTVAEPTLLGQVAFDEGGRFTFRGVRYDIESGTVTFASTRGLAPILDIHARAEVKGYDLTVSLVGTWPRIQMSFSSDPPLPNETIFALLLTGTTPSTGAQSDTTSPIVSVGAGIAAGAVTGGITRGTQRVLKLERFEIDPIFTGGQLTDVRSTIGKQITPDILFTYSQSFETTKLPIVQVEWRISNTVILRAQRDENGIYLIDVRRRKRF